MGDYRILQKTGHRFIVQEWREVYFDEHTNPCWLDRLFLSKQELAELDEELSEPYTEEYRDIKEFKTLGAAKLFKHNLELKDGIVVG
jgi:hypothetical protein